MKRLNILLRRGVLAALGTLAMTGCHVNDEMPLCPDVQITYRYYPTADAEQLPDYVHSMTHLLFENDVLVGSLWIDHTSTHRAEGLMVAAVCRGGQTLRQLSLDLPAGNYTLMSWGNQDDAISTLEPWVMGQTTRAQIILAQQNLQTRAVSAYDDSERLYFGTTAFTAGGGPVSRNVDMLCAHMQLDVTVRWKNVLEYPDMAQPIQLFLDGVPVEYNQQVSHTLSLGITGTPVYGPGTTTESVPALTGVTGLHYAPASVQSASELTARFVTYRLRDTDHPLLSILQNGISLMDTPQIDLETFFTANSWKRTDNRRQYFSILIEIDGPLIEVSGTIVTDWTPGGSVGGQ